MLVNSYDQENYVQIVMVKIVVIKKGDSHILRTRVFRLSSVLEHMCS